MATFAITFSLESGLAVMASKARSLTYHMISKSDFGRPFFLLENFGMAVLAVEFMAGVNVS